MKIAVFAGSFDPITKGHEDLVRRACGLFDRIVVAIGTNSDKRCMFDVEQRLKWIRQTFADLPEVGTACYSGLTTDFCKEVGAQYMLRGIRNANDLAYEQQIADINRRVAPEIETVMLLTRPELADVSSSAVRELLRYGKSVAELVPTCLDV